MSPEQASVAPGNRTISRCCDCWSLSVHSRNLRLPCRPPTMCLPRAIAPASQSLSFHTAPAPETSHHSHTVTADLVCFQSQLLDVNIYAILQPIWYLPSVLWCCWLGGRKGIRPVKTERWGAGMVICLERDADLHMAQLMPLPLTVSCFSKIQIGFTFLVPAHPR